jgi:hypothetical protein
MSHTRAVLILGLAAVVACSDRTPTTATAPTAPPGVPAVEMTAPSTTAPERLASLFARALGDPGFRAYVKAQLDSSPYPEHKIQLQGFLAARGGRAVHDIARANGIADGDVSREAARAIPLEAYLPVPAHRATWSGDENVLVATAVGDRDAPVAFSPDGQRTLLRADAPPAIPVIAVVPVETNFQAPARATCIDCSGGGGGGGTSTPLGLFMTKAHFEDDFEGWLKGEPEYELHVLGQSGATDSLTDYQCVGADAGGPYAFDQNANDWSGNVLMFSQKQLDDYKAAHPGQSVRLFAMEDDDTPCKIIMNKDDLNRLFKLVDSLYAKRTGGRDTTTTVGKYFKAAKVLRNLWTMVASFIKTNDDLIGTAVEDQVIGAFYTGFNWIIKGQNNITNGWLKLEMR